MYLHEKKDAKSPTIGLKVDDIENIEGLKNLKNELNSMKIKLYINFTLQRDLNDDKNERGLAEPRSLSER